MKVLVLDGTPDEIRQVFPDLISFGPLATPASPTSQASALSAVDEPAILDAKAPISADIAYEMLTRIPLSSEQVKVLSTIYHAAPELVSATTLMEITKYTRPQFSGLMGAFGRRLVNTEGYVERTWFFDQEWDSEKGINYYGLPPSVREAMEKAKIV